MYSPLEQFEIYGLSFIPNPFFLLEFFAGGVVGQGFILLINEY
jgi:hypothetical protein